MDYLKRLRDLRENNDKTQSEIAAILHTSQTMYGLQGKTFKIKSEIDFLSTSLFYFSLSVAFGKNFENYIDF